MLDNIMTNILITGVAGFIGSSLAKLMILKNFNVIGIDNLNNYYDLKLKNDRIFSINNNFNFRFIKADLNDNNIYDRLDFDVDIIIHLAAQAGVRYSLENPNLYIENNINAYVKLLEYAKRINVKHLIFASSSSVYGLDSKIPFSLHEKISSPTSLYAATKISGEAISYSYSHLYNIPITILRFFTVYGPWGRPDMAIYNFTKSIFDENMIELYDKGNLFRDFTYIDDIIAGIASVIDKTPSYIQTYNLGNNQSKSILNLINILENNIGKKAKIKFTKAPKTEMINTYADISKSISDFGYNPKTSLTQGIENFVSWYKSYHKII